MVHLVTLRLALTDNDIQKNSRAKKAYDDLENKIRDNEVKEQAKVRTNLKKLLKKVQDNKLAEADKKKLELLGVKENKTKQLEDLINLTKVINTMNVDIDEEDLPKTLQASLKRYRKQQDMEQQKINAEPNKVIAEIKNEQKEQAQIKTKQLETIEPLQLFSLLHYVNDKKLRGKLQQILHLNDQMLPNDYLIFENLNQIVEKTHLTGQYFDHQIKKSQIAKDFEKVEQELINKVDIKEFQDIPTNVIQRIKAMNYEINAIVSIQQKFNPATPKDKNIYIKLVVKILHECYNQIPSIKGKKAFATYILHVLDILEVRNRLTRNKFLDMVKEISEKKGLKTTLSKEVKGLIPKELADTITKINNQDMESIENVELVDELGNELTPKDNASRHINDDNIYNDYVEDEVLLEENESFDDMYDNTLEDALL